uniref:CCHC-type domain-containing protein n=1 Tax=Tanacetum cinerariifolium TaxID=118510 RepID=A0A699IK40_TANCI|nr:hypothetical protein [Tanacetum cinerariifolium]
MLRTLASLSTSFYCYKAFNHQWDQSKTKHEYSMNTPILEYLQNKHYALWEVIEIGDSYLAPQEETGKGSASESFAKKKGRIVAITTEDMQKRRIDVKARTTLMLALPDEHQLRFSKYETAQELLQAIVSHLEFMDVEIKQDDLNQKFLTSLALKWLMADMFWKKTGKKITIQGSDVAGFDKSKVECFNCHKMGHFVRECRAPRSQDRGKRESYRQGRKEEEQAPKALMAIDGIGWDWSYMANKKRTMLLLLMKKFQQNLL